MVNMGTRVERFLTLFLFLIVVIAEIMSLHVKKELCQKDFAPR